MKAVPWLLCLLLTACADIPSPLARRQQADLLAAGRDWQPEILATGAFELVAYLPREPDTAKQLTIYVEGDGLAWLDRTTPSIDPTPADPMALRLALAQPEGSVAYLARPCQYVGAQQPRCPAKYWTSARFAPEVIVAASEAIDRLKGRFKAEQLVLVGYSGGAAVAALVAARRTDVRLFVSVAGNLDHVSWARLHRLQPLRKSLNPVDETAGLAHLPQLLFAGGKDTNVTADLARSYISRYAEGDKPRLHVEPEFGHQCCWVDAWPKLWSKYVLPGSLAPAR